MVSTPFEKYHIKGVNKVDVYVMTLHLGDLWYCLCLMQIQPLMSNPGICHGSIILYYLCLPKSSKLCQWLQHYKNRSNEECFDFESCYIINLPLALIFRNQEAHMFVPPNTSSITFLFYLNCNYLATTFNRPF